MRFPMNNINNNNSYKIRNIFIGIKEGTVIYVKILGGRPPPLPPPSVVGPEIDK